MTDNGETRYANFPGTRTGFHSAETKIFHGTVEVSPATAKMRMVQIAEEIVFVRRARTPPHFRRTLQRMSLRSSLGCPELALVRGDPMPCRSAPDFSE